MTQTSNILAALAYFDMFDYPLRKKEIFLFLREKCGYAGFESDLNYLLLGQWVFNVGDFYSLRNDHSLCQKRLLANDRADALLKRASRGAKLISKFPYVRGVGISGSLSKNVADEVADVDYFIITSPNRLWIARSFLHLFKKFTFLFGRQHLYCMNYFVDEAQLEIIEKNQYTAIEIATLIPVFGKETFEAFYASNQWAFELLPNYYNLVMPATPLRGNFLQQFLEKLFNNRFGTFIDKSLMKVTARSWVAKAKRQQRNLHGDLLALDTSLHHAKPSPANFQQKLLRHYSTRLAEITDAFETSNSTHAQP